MECMHAPTQGYSAWIGTTAQDSGKVRGLFLALFILCIWSYVLKLCCYIKRRHQNQEGTWDTWKRPNGLSILFRKRCSLSPDRDKTANTCMTTIRYWYTNSLAQLDSQKGWLWLNVHGSETPWGLLCWGTWMRFVMVVVIECTRTSHVQQIYLEPWQHLGLYRL